LHTFAGVVSKGLGENPLWAHEMVQVVLTKSFAKKWNRETDQRRI
jgi:hypothetical protein